MANRHFGKFADVWKHLVLDEVLARHRPERYAETHAGSAAYPMVRDAERGYGVAGFLDAMPASGALASAAFPGLVSGFLARKPALYPGSALQAMTLLGDACAYLLCDTDPASAEDLRRWASRLGLSRCEVVQRDGMSAVEAWLGDRHRTVVHIDPFDPFESPPGGRSAVELAAAVAEAGHLLVYWYGVSAPDERAWALEEIGSRTAAPLWCGDLLVDTQRGSTRSDGDLGAATTPGTGCGVLLGNAAPDLAGRCEELAHALVEAYDGAVLPNGQPGRLGVALRHRG